METTRKCLTKIITNRLSLICKNNNILRGPNFAGLPGESTLEPIQLLNNICEEAREQNKELWILFQDTAKAFDTVNLEMLERALKRIKIPKKMTKLIINLFKGQKNQNHYRKWLHQHYNSKRWYRPRGNHFTTALENLL